MKGQKIITFEFSYQWKIILRPRDAKSDYPGFWYTYIPKPLQQQMELF